jgi:S1-C subfamily serine protease
MTSRSILRIEIAIVLALAVALLPRAAHADDPGPAPATPALSSESERCAPGWQERIYAKVRPAVVRLKVGDVRGAGFLWGAPGQIVTAYHVVNVPGAIVVVFADGTERAARVLSADVRFDVALLEIPGPVPVGSPLEARDPQTVPIGAPLAAIGHPYAHELSGEPTQHGLFSWALTVGILSGRNSDLLLTDVALNPGNSGGPILDCEGRVVGIDSAGYYTLGVAISSVHAVDIARHLTGRPFSLQRWFAQSRLALGLDGYVQSGIFLAGPSLALTVPTVARIEWRTSVSGLWSPQQTMEGASVVTSRTGVRAREAVGVAFPSRIASLVVAAGATLTALVEHQLQLGPSGLQGEDVGHDFVNFSPSLEVRLGRVTAAYEADIDFVHVGQTASTFRLAAAF